MSIYEEKKQITREKIMKVALKLFSSNGYYKTSTNLIASEAKVNESTLFRHFKTKEELFQATTEEYVRVIDVKNEVEKSKKGNFKQTMLEISRKYLNYCYLNERLYRIQMRLQEDMKSFVKLKLSRSFKEALIEYFQTLLDEGEIQGNPEIMAVSLVNSLLGMYHVYLLSDKQFTDISIDELLIEHVDQFTCKYHKGDKSE